MEAGVIGLAHLRREAADQVEVAARAQPGALNQRRGGERGAAHDVGLCRGGSQIAGDAGLQPVRPPGIDQRRRPGRRARPDLDLLDRQHGAIGLRKQCRHAAGADHQQAPRIGPRQPGRGQRRGRCGAARGDLVAVDLCQRRAAARVVQHVGRVQPGQALRGVAGKDVDGLDAQVTPGAPRRHDQHRALHTVCAGQRVRVPQRHFAAFDEHPRQGLDQRVEGQCLASGHGIEVFHRVAASLRGARCAHRRHGRRGAQAPAPGGSRRVTAR